MWSGCLCNGYWQFSKIKYNWSKQRERCSDSETNRETPSHREESTNAQKTSSLHPINWENVNRRAKTIPKKATKKSTISSTRTANKIKYGISECRHVQTSLQNQWTGWELLPLRCRTLKGQLHPLQERNRFLSFFVLLYAKKASEKHISRPIHRDYNNNDISSLFITLHNRNHLFD